jgi:hypothetical protein
MPDARSLVIVGESNPYGGDPSFALYHLPREASGNRLREHVGLSDEEYERLEKVNLCPGEWSMPIARARAKELLGLHDVIVTLGAKVRTAFSFHWPNLREVSPFWRLIDIETGQQIVTLPHPSGLSRPWYAPDARDKARTVLREAAPWVPWGSDGGGAA